jgi:alpha-L-fucosidase 2
MLLGAFLAVFAGGALQGGEHESSVIQGREVVEHVEKRDALHRSPRLEIDRAIARWDEGLPIGNGLMGVLVWGEGDVIRLSLDRGDLWDTRLPEMLTRPDWTWATMIALKEAKDHKKHQEMFDVPYDTVAYPTKLPAGRVEIVMPAGEKVTGFRMELGTGGASVEVERDVPGQAEVRALGTVGVAMEPRHAVVYGKGLPRGCSVRLVWPGGFKKLGYAEPERGGDGRRQWYVQRTAEGRVIAVVVALGESKPPHDGQPTLQTLAAAIVTDADDPEPLKEANARVDAALDVYRNTAVQGEDADWWRAAFRASSVTIPDARLQQHYDLCKHFYVSASRPDAPPMPLQGVWTADEGGLPPWKGDYHNDLNTQMTYLAYPTAGLFDQGRSWIEFNWKLLPAYRKFARKFYGIGRDQSSPAALIPGVMTIDGKAMGGWGQYSLSPTHSAWICHQFYMHWKYTGDEEFLRARALPFCREVSRGLRALLRTDERGKPVLPLSSSPEIHDNSYRAWLPPNSNYDQSLLRWLFAAWEEMESAASDGKAAGEPLRGMVERLEPLDVDAQSKALTFARGMPYDQSHRHFSHAMAIYPLGTMTIEGSEADRETIAATIERLHTVGTKQWVGYSFSWMGAMCARAGQGERALDYLTQYLAFTGTNGFHLNGDQTKSGLSDFTYRPFTLEGNFIAMQAVHEMLLQSWGVVGKPNSSVIRIFPAMSEKWKDAAFENLWAEGGFQVSAKRESGKAVMVRVKATRTGMLVLRDPFGEGGARWNRGVERDGVLIRVILSAGEVLEGVVEAK